MANNYNENAIREAAYYIWQNAGCPSGMESQHWAMAIEQLYSNKNSGSSSKKCSSSSCKKTSSASSKKNSGSSSKKTSK